MRQEMTEPSKLGGKQGKCSAKRAKRALLTTSTEAEKSIRWGQRSDHIIERWSC